MTNILYINPVTGNVIVKTIINIFYYYYYLFFINYLRPLQIVF